MINPSIVFFMGTSVSPSVGRDRSYVDASRTKAVTQIVDRKLDSARFAIRRAIYVGEMLQIRLNRFPLVPARLYPPRWVLDNDYRVYGRCNA